MITYLRRRAALKGPLGGSRSWTALWAVLLAARLLRRVTSDRPEVVYCEPLAPGEALVITGVQPVRGGRRRRTS